MDNSERTAPSRVIELWLAAGRELPPGGRLNAIAEVQRLGIHRFEEVDILRAINQRTSFSGLFSELQKQKYGEPHTPFSGLYRVCGSCDVAITPEGLCNCSGRPEGAFRF